MILTKLFVRPPNKEAIGKWGPGSLLLRAERSHEFFNNALNVYDNWYSHKILYFTKSIKEHVTLAPAQSILCPRTNEWYLIAHLGSVPLILESTTWDTIIIRVGYRNDWKYRTSYKVS